MASAASKSGGFARLVPLAVMGAGVAAFFALGLHKYLAFEQLRLHRWELMGYVAGMPVKAVIFFTIAYAVATALSLPGGAVLTLTGGFLFGIVEGTAAVVVGATTGATALFLAARTALADVLRGKAGPWLSRMEAGFRDDALSYLLVLRLIPAFPFFVVNLVPAFLGVSLRTFVIATFLGIIPGTFVFASIGAGLGSIFDRMQEPSLKGALTPEVIIALVGLAALSVIPAVNKRLKSRKAS
ncbi:MAG: TVP38/TMEM64 family protein [Hyphomicrobiaceae bacterium]|nr:MAG: TVP38/TMEM64 family protein [Hyphomicrobiaceae bacterium]